MTQYFLQKRSQTCMLCQVYSICVEIPSQKEGQFSQLVAVLNNPLVNALDHVELTLTSRPTNTLNG